MASSVSPIDSGNAAAGCDNGHPPPSTSRGGDRWRWRSRLTSAAANRGKPTAALTTASGRSGASSSHRRDHSTGNNSIRSLSSWSSRRSARSRSNSEERPPPAPAAPLSSATASHPQAQSTSYSPLHTLIASLDRWPTPVTTASFILSPDEVETPLSSDIEEELDGLGLVESLVSLVPASGADGDDNDAANSRPTNTNISSGQGVISDRTKLEPCTEASISSHWSCFTRHYRRSIILFSLVLLCPVGLYHCLPAFINSADSSFDPPLNTYSGKALNIFRAAYGGMMNCDGRVDNITGIAEAAAKGRHTSEYQGLSSSDPLNPPLIIVMDAVQSAENSTDFRGKPNLIDGWSSMYMNAKGYAVGIEDYLRQHSPLGLQYPVPCRCSCANGTGCDEESNSTTRWITMQPDLVVTSYYSLAAEGLPTTLAPATVAADKKTAVLEVAFSIPPSVAAKGHLKREYVRGIMDSLSGYGDATAVNGTQARGFKISYTGLRYLEADLTSSVQSSLHKMDIFVLPLALAVLMVVLSWTGHSALHSPRIGLYSHFFPHYDGKNMRSILFVVAIPIMTIGTSVGLWSTIMHLLSRWSVLQVSHFTPTIMMSLTAGMGLDYIMFMMSRALSEDPSKFGRNEDSSNKGEVDAAQTPAQLLLADLATSQIVERTIHTAGHTVLTSGITLSVGFLGLVVLPLPMLRSAGFGSAVAILSCVIVNLTLVPAVLHTKVVARILLSPPETHGTTDTGQKAHRHRRGWWRKRRGSDGGGGLRLFGDGGIFEDSDRNGTGFGFLWLSGISLASDGRSRAGGSEHNVEDVDGTSGPPEVEGGDTGYTSFRDLVQPLLMESDDPIRTDRCTQRSDEEGNLQAITLGEQVSHSCVPPSSPWRGLALVLLHPFKATLVLLIIVATVAPVALHCLQIDTSISFELMLPTNSPAMATSRELGGTFGLGKLSPYRMIFDGRDADKDCDTEEAFEVMHAVINSLVKYNLNHSSIEESDVSPSDSVSPFHLPYGTGGHVSEGHNKTSYNGIAHIRGFNVPHALFASAKICTQNLEECPVENLRALSALDDRMTSSDRKTTYMTATLAVDPFSDEGIDWLVAAREILQALGDQNILRNYTVAVEGGAAVEYDVVQEVFRNAPRCIGLTLVIIFILMALFFRSIVAPLRSLVCICLTQGFSFGMLVLTYQQGLFKWTGIQNLVGTGELSWLAPVLAFSIVVGLNLDYEIFLIDRVLEFRQTGACHVSSIVAGVHVTGPIISAAGIIMAVAFGGLMLCPSPALYQWSFLLTTAVLFDTSIGRMVRVVLLGYTAQYSWWPRALPPEKIDLLQDDGQAGTGTNARIEEDYEKENGGDAILAMRRG